MARYAGKLRAQLSDYETKARNQGRQNLPPSNAVGPDENESRLLNETRKWDVDSRARFDAKVTEAQNRLAQLRDKAGQTKALIDALLIGAGKSDIARQHLELAKPQLIGLRATELRCLAELRGFKHEHGLRREAHYPKDHLYHFAIIFVAVALEALVNASFFENGRGFIGGTVVALGASAMNIGPAVLLGYLFRYHNHIRVPLKVVGWSAFVVFILWSIFVNAVISVFRDEYALVTDPDSAKETAAAFVAAVRGALQVFTLEIPFRGLTSFALFVVGWLLAIYAFYKGYSWDDPYPGHGPVHRRWVEAQQAYTAPIESVQGEVRRLLEKERGELLGLQTTLLSDANRVSQVVGDLEVAGNECSAELQEVANDCRLVLEAYRQLNLSVRTTPPPAHFAQIAIPISNGYQGNMPAALMTADGARRLYDDVKSVYLAQLANRAQDIMREAASAESRLLTVFLKDVQEDAERRVAADRPAMGAPLVGDPL